MWHYLWIHLSWWGMTLWAAYTIYFILRAYHIWDVTTSYGLKKGYKIVFFGYNPEYFRLYHLARMILDVPPSLLGLLFPVLRAILRFRIYKFKQPEKVVKSN